MIVLTLARKPLDGTVAETVQRHGTGGINIDGTRVSGEPVPINRLEQWSGFGQVKQPDYAQTMNTKGRWPPNALLTHAPECGKTECATGCAIAEMDRQSGILTSGKVAAHHKRNSSTAPANGGFNGGFGDCPLTGYGDSGGASRFFPQFRYPPKG